MINRNDTTAEGQSLLLLLLILLFSRNKYLNGLGLFHSNSVLFLYVECCSVCLWSQVLGTPTREQIREMNPNYTEFKFPQIKAHPWTKVSKQVQVNCFITSSTAALHLHPSARLHSIHITRLHHTGLADCISFSVL